MSFYNEIVKTTRQVRATSSLVGQIKDKIRLKARSGILCCTYSSTRRNIKKVNEYT